MNRLAKIFLVLAAPLLLAALGMDEQPSFKAYEAPVLSPPEGAVPLSGKETVSWQDQLSNPTPSTAASVGRGETLFGINCALCHGRKAGQPGPVGQKLTPPPPSLYLERIQKQDDPYLFKVITFGFGRMPSFGSKIAARDRWDLVNFLRTLK